LVRSTPPSNVERSLSGFALMLGMRGTTDDLVHQAIAFPADDDAACRASRSAVLSWPT
jgi:hypothetical protein